MFSLFKRFSRSGGLQPGQPAADASGARQDRPKPSADDRKQDAKGLTPASWPPAEQEKKKPQEIIMWGGGCCG